MAEHFEILFEPYDTPPAGVSGDATLVATAPMAMAWFTDIAFDTTLIATAPMATAYFVTGDVGGGPTPPAISTLYATAPMAMAYFSDLGAARLDATAPMATALMFDTSQQDILIATAPVATAFFTEEVPAMEAYFNIAWYGDYYCAAWTGHQAVELTETLALSSASTVEMIVLLREQLNLSGGWRSLISATHAMTESLVLADALQIVWHVLLEERLALADVAQQNAVAIVRTVERLVLSGMADSVLEANIALAEVLALADAGEYVWVQELTESLELGDSVEARIAALVPLLETLEVSATAPMTLTATVALDESLVLVDEAGTQLTANVVLLEALELFGTLRIGDDVYSCWVINTESKGVARYTNYPFNSFAKAPWGEYIGATDVGLHVLGGDTDDGEPIHAAIRSGLTDFGSRHLKRLPTMYLGYTSTGQVGLKVIHTSEAGNKVEDHYLLEPRPAGDVRESRFKVGRGIKSVYLGFEVVNVAGADFALDVVEWLPVKLDRRVS